MKVSSVLFSFFGTPTDIDNLQVLTAKENSLKAAIWGLYVNINADKKWAKMSPTTQIVSIPYDVLSRWRKTNKRAGRYITHRDSYCLLE